MCPSPLRSPQQKEENQLKVLSNEMHPAEIRFFRKTFIKERGTEVFRKIHPPPILWEPFKDSTASRTAVGN